SVQKGDVLAEAACGSARAARSLSDRRGTRDGPHRLRDLWILLSRRVQLLFLLHRGSCARRASSHASSVVDRAGEQHMTSDPCTVEVITTTDGLVELAPIWDELVARSGVT